MRQLIDSMRAAWRGLRCRPGDLCWVRRNLWGLDGAGQPVLEVRGGAVVRVVELFAGQPDMWRLERPIFLPGQGAVITGIRDRSLCPMRDRPGRDEIFRYAVPPELMHQQAIGRQPLPEKDPHESKSH